jgi:hypothetical protein
MSTLTELSFASARLRCGWLVGAFSFALACGPSQAARQPSQPDQGQVRIVGCFAAQAWIVDVLKELGLALGTTIEVRFGTGSIPGLDGHPNDLQVEFLGRDRNRAFLGLGSIAGDGKVTISPDGYTLERRANRWVAGEGNGGLATYEAVGRYADGLEKRPVVRLSLTPRPGGQCEGK